jgi:serine/threonine-protein kinase SRPK3
MEKAEVENPSDRKIVDDTRTIYRSRTMPKSRFESWGLPILCDFGEARFADRENTDLIQPEQYRAPEVLLGQLWNEKVDIWNLGCMVSAAFCTVGTLHAHGAQIWHLFEDKNLFKAHDGEGKQSNFVHLSHITAYLGRPPRQLMKKGGQCAEYFEEDGAAFSLDRVFFHLTWRAIRNLQRRASQPLVRGRRGESGG